MAFIQILVFAITTILGLPMTQNLTAKSARMLALPLPGSPISFEQTETYTNKLNDGAVVQVKVVGRTYRDSAGRLRIETIEGKTCTQVSIIDPTTGSSFLLLTASHNGYRIPFRTPQIGSFAIAESLESPEIDAAHKWDVNTQVVGEKNIEGVQFTGTRLTKIAEDNPQLESALEQWYSAHLKLIGAAKGSGSQRSYDIRIDHLQQGEQDSTLFVIPPNYRILEVDLPPFPAR